VQLVGHGLLVAFGPPDHSRVLEGDHLPLLQTLEGNEHPVCPARASIGEAERDGASRMFLPLASNPADHLAPQRRVP
jgi:hypothetical protein